MELFLEKLRKNLLKRMESLSLTQCEVATAARVQQPSLSRFLSGKAAPNLESAVRLARYLGAHLIYPNDTASPVLSDDPKVAELEEENTRLKAENHDLKIENAALEKALRIATGREINGMAAYCPPIQKNDAAN